jgi:hypothetical protein
LLYWRIGVKVVIGEDCVFRITFFSQVVDSGSGFVLILAVAELLLIQAEKELLYMLSNPARGMNELFRGGPS